MKDKTKISLAKIIRFFTNLLKNDPDFHGKVITNLNDGNIPSVKIEKTVLLDTVQPEHQEQKTT